ncbi:MAG TPA: hypothetical protein VHB70_09800 [Parafilimonas sp.]|nr:hypothetical protein [Parafilimonas sp.]
MTHKTHYDTVSKAIEELRRQGFTTDFNIDEDKLACSQGKYSTKDFEVMDVYRYEGDSDPGDEAAVYAIKSHDGTKGVLVTGYGASDDISKEMMDKLSSAQRD